MSFFKRLFGKKKKEDTTEKVVEETTEEVVEETTEEVVEETTEEVVEETTEEVVEETVNADRYEIKPHKEEGWQVIKVGATRARRRFSTQAECINYCKEMKYKFDLFGKDGEPR